MEDQQTFPSSFGELLKTHRKRKRLTQKQLAQQLGVHANTISSWELGTYLPDTRGLVLELARHLALDEQETRQLLEASLTALSPHWLVPLSRNPFFTGREEILEALHTHLHVEQVVALTQSYALRGLGGIGKTQIAQTSIAHFREAFTERPRRSRNEEIHPPATLPMSEIT